MSERDGELDAGDFSAWLGEMRAALRDEGDANVPCGTCTACCTSAQFVHIAPDEIDTLAHVPTDLLFPAPRMPKGHVLLGYDENGHCPMLDDGACSIYDHRPRTCRAYDCRVFPAAGVHADKPHIAERSTRWRFTYAADAGCTEHDGVRAIATALQVQHPDASATERAVRAVQLTDRAGPDPISNR